MAVFKYKALDGKGHKTSGIIEGDSQSACRLKLREQNLIPLEITQNAAVRFSRFNGISVKNLAIITRHLSALLLSGMPLDSSLLAISEQCESTKLKNHVMSVRSQVLAGSSLANSLASLNNVFPKLYIAAVRAAEETGDLASILQDLADYYEKRLEVRQKISQALLYPMFMTIISFAIVIFLLSYVVPKMLSVFQQAHQQLPLMTKILLFISHSFSSYGIYMLLFFIIVLVLLIRLFRIEKWQNHLHQFLLRIPLVGNMIKLIETARYCQALAMLNAASVDMIKAMKTATQLIKFIPIKKALMEAYVKINEGARIATSLQATHFFPAITIHLITSGENSGQLAAMLQRAADAEERDIARTLSTFLTLFEPILILLMGCIVLFIVLAILLPIFSIDQMAGLS